MGKLRHHNFIRPIAWLLCLLLCVAVLPVTAHALEGTTGDLTWRFSGGTLTISGQGAMPDYSDDIMPPWYDVSENIAKIRVGEGVTELGSLAFYGCANARGVALPSTLTRIGDRAFKGCSTLSYLAFPAGLTTIGEAAFEDCVSLDNIRLPAGLTTIGHYAFYRCTSLSSITVPASVTNMGMVVFAYCDNLKSATILCPISTVPDWTFYHCTTLQSLTLPPQTSSVGSRAFQDCASLTQLYYAGPDASADTLVQKIRETSGTASAVTVVEDAHPQTVTVITGSSVNPGGTTGTVSTSTTSNTDNASITRQQDTAVSYTKDGESITLGELEELTQGDDPVSGISGQANINTTIVATVDNSDGWTELAETVSDSRPGTGNTGKVDVEVHINGSTVSGEDLGKLSGTDATIDIITGGGETWRVDTGKLNDKDVSGKTYDLGYTVERTEDGATTIESDRVYRVDFDGDVDIASKVAININADNGGKYATLYEKKGKEYTIKETVLVDNAGDAWFSAGSISGTAEYYVGVNVKGVDTTNATVPHTMYQQYGVDDDATLWDAQGNRYEVGQRESRWGISGKRFALYVGIALGAVILVVAFVMITMNIIRRSREQNLLRQAPVEESEEEMRLRVMQEMLHEKENGVKHESGKPKQ